MARTKLLLVLEDFEGETKRALRLIHSLSHAKGVSRGKLTQTQYEMIVELAYLRAFLAWESFLEQSFLLYMLGKKAPNGFGPKIYALPVNQEHAWEMSKGEQRFPDWTTADTVIRRAGRFMKDGKPFDLALRTKSSDLQDMKTMRNAIAHQSRKTDDSFEKVVRKVMGHYPPQGISVGGFLDSLHPKVVPQTTIIEHYFDLLRQIARIIVPS